MIKLLVIVGLVAAPAAVGVGVWAGQNKTPPESVLAVRQNAPLVAKPGREAAAAAKTFAKLEPPPPPPPAKPAGPPPPDVAVTFRHEVRALAPEEGRVVLVGSRSLKLGDKYGDGWKLAEVTSRTARLTKGKDQRIVDFFQPDPAAVQALAAQTAQSASLAQVSFTNGQKPGQLSPTLTAQLMTMMRQSGLAQVQIDQMKKALDSGPATQAQLMPIIMGMARNGRVQVAELDRFIESLARVGIVPEPQVMAIEQTVQSLAQSRQTEGIVQQLNRPQPGQFGPGGRGGPNGGFGGPGSGGRGGFNGGGGGGRRAFGQGQAGGVATAPPGALR